MNRKLEEYLSQPDKHILDKVIKKYDYLKEPKVFISKEDEMCDELMQYLGEHKRGDISFSIEPKTKKSKDGIKIDGVMLSFNVVF